MNGEMEQKPLPEFPDATPRPWEANCADAIVGRFINSKGLRCTAFLASCQSATEDNQANRDLIVAAVNSYNPAAQRAAVELSEYITLCIVDHGKYKWETLTEKAHAFRRASGLE